MALSLSSNWICNLKKKVPGFCCPAPGGRCNYSVARPVQPRSFRIILDREARDYAARASASLSFAPIGCEPFHGLFMPGKNNVFQHTSILVQPRQNPRLPRAMVELPGTAPGSAVPIARRHLSP
jgi:hypothetical protein